MLILVRAAGGGELEDKEPGNKYLFLFEVGTFKCKPCYIPHWKLLNVNHAIFHTGNFETFDLTRFNP